LNDRRQFAVGLHCAPTPVLVATALERLLESEPAGDSFGASLTRTYVLELAAGLHTASTCVPPTIRMPLRALCGHLFANPSLAEADRRSAEYLVGELRDWLSARPSALALRVRAVLDSCERRTPTTDLARRAATNARDMIRAFKAAYGLTPSQYHRDQLGAVALERATAGAPVKRIAAELGCSDATVRRLVHQTTGETVRTLKRSRPGGAGPVSRSTR
jgi:AraC-like DNA-binding protein